MGLKINLAEQPLLYHTSHYSKNLFWLFFDDLIGSRVLDLIRFYQYDKLQILQQEDRKVDGPRL